jgi:hypothetical protein
MSDFNKLRTEIRRIMSEMVQLNEARKTSEVDDFVNSYFRNANFFTDGEPVLSQMATEELINECADELRSVISQIQSGNLPYENFYILKLSDFLLKSSGYLKLTFENTEISGNSLFKPIASSFLVYVYHDTIFRVVPYNEKFDTETKIENDANKFIQSPEFDQIFGTPKQRAKFIGEIKTMYFEKKIKVYTNYFNPVDMGKKADSEKKGDYAKEKKLYRPNTPLIHKIFGKGIIKSAKKVKDQGDDNYYILDVDFPEHGSKRIRMKSAA